MQSEIKNRSAKEWPMTFRGKISIITVWIVRSKT